MTDKNLTVVQDLGDIFTDPALRMNEGGCDPQGRFYCGSVGYACQAEAGTLYQLSADGTVRAMLNGITTSNGLQWASTSDTVYYIDSATGRIDSFDFDAADGAFSNRSPFVTIDPDLGKSDGMTIDAQGGLWVALWGGGAVHRYDTDGRLTERIEVGA